MCCSPKFYNNLEIIVNICDLYEISKDSITTTDSVITDCLKKSVVVLSLSFFFSLLFYKCFHLQAPEKYIFLYYYICLF